MKTETRQSAWAPTYACGHSNRRLGYLVCPHIPADFDPKNPFDFLAQITDKRRGEITGIIRCQRCRVEDAGLFHAAGEPSHPLNDAFLLYCVDCVEREGWLPEDPEAEAN